MRVVFDIELTKPIFGRLIIPIGFASEVDAIRWLKKPDNHRMINKIRAIHDHSRVNRQAKSVSH